MLKLCVLTGDPRLPDLTKRGHRYNEEDLATHAAMRAALQGLNRFALEVFDDHARLLERFAADPPALVLNFCDTGFRNVATQELHVPALLELLGVPYSGATPACMALCYDKQIVRLVAEAQGIPVPREVYLAPDTEPRGRRDAAAGADQAQPGGRQRRHHQGCGGAHAAEAEAYLAWLQHELPGRAVLIQEYLPGPEYGVGLIGNPDDELVALPALEVDYARLPAGLAPILSFESKAMPDSPYWTEIKFKPAEAAPELQTTIADQARRLFARLGCRDYARFDFRVAADGEPKLMEVNPNPAWAYDGKLAFMAGFAGIDYPGMLEMIVDAALRRTGLD